jgi:glycogen debranching enzyme
MPLSVSMPVEVSVLTPVLSINHGSTFMVTDINGEIAAESEQGVFANDTRFVSYYALFANGQPWARLSSAVTTYHSVLIYLSNPAFSTEAGDVAAGTLTLAIRRSIDEGIHEAFEVTNHNQATVRFNLEVALRSDFADLFEVRRHEFVRRGRIVTEWNDAAGELSTTYTNHDFHRRFIYRLLHGDSPVHYANGRIVFELDLPPGAVWRACCYYELAASFGPRPAPPGCDEVAGAELGARMRWWLSQATRLRATNENLERLYRQSVEDMGALRLYDHDFAPDVWVPAAGVPWYVTIFGRDSLIVSLQNMMVHAGFARGALKKLAQFQATAMDDWRDAEPGKILHELRYGELAHFHLIPHTPYYGTADATPLYLIALHETWKWLGDDDILREYREVALRCLEWIDRYGDLDGDGFQEYKTRSAKGYENMGWKDAADAVVYPDGSRVYQPKALVELQGYVFDAWMRMAEVFDRLREPERAADLRQKAERLRTLFEERFWCEEEGFYAFALDPAKRRVCTVTSNPGHCLWSGIVSRERAGRVVERLQAPDMWSGWGIRTLSSRNPAYNPTSYHRGSVWPHDNGIIALGMKRYGFAAAASRVARDISVAAGYFVAHRLPELWSGFERRPHTYPVQYQGANVPQAWAAGAVFHLLQAILGLQADAPHGVLNVDPQLPRWLPELTLRGLTVGHAKLDLRFRRSGETTRWEVLRQEGDIQVREQVWGPW